MTATKAAPGKESPAASGDAPEHRPRGEVRLPAALATLVAIALYALLPQDVLIGPRFVIPGLEMLLLISLLVVNPVRMSRQNRVTRGLSIVIVVVIAAANLASLGLVLRELVSKQEGLPLLVAALQVWATDVIVFGLAFWEIDRGGPVVRNLVDRRRLPRADFRFPQDEDKGTVVEVDRGSSQASGWMPTFIDYLYVSLSNSSAFSPTDTMPLSHRAKLLMGVESTAALITSVLVIARGVGNLS
ncbi:hypothetical protein [Rugosimonospora africana]|uniref:DUF1345 domain-containing protein n=1 Tax=Rugosimonospora africana TaxID=556532 RepID=A0A8J3VT46_9ACTN|nr:hypothetical protein [Rugosimonospora africana]GIH17709.1 hypothetical protein Raf01_58810 [Rugosimonospora africana]